jgi:peptide/nickel transport system substrate-binding protein
MRCTKSRSFASISAALLLLCPAKSALAAKRPRYGGTLRVELHATSISLDPRQWKPGSLATAENEKLAALVYDRLISLDEFGKFHPALATEWSHDADGKIWQFKLRTGVKFSDGSALTPSDVLASLQNELPPGTQIATSESGMVIRSTHPNSDLLLQLATGNSFIYRAERKGVLLGTGPFYVSEMSPAPGTESLALAPAKSARLRFRANEETWSGRPFLNSIEVTLGVPQLHQLLDLQLGKADLVEVAPDLVRKARQENLRIWSSSPNTLLALRFDDKQPAPGDARLRQALSLSLERETMANVLLQRQAEPAASLLPQWLSGYAFLFDSPADLQLAKEMRLSLPANFAAGKDPLRMRLGASGDLMKLLGERVALNARQANIMVQLLPHAPELVEGGPTSTNAPSPDLHLIAWHYETISPNRELEALVSQLHLQENAEGAHAGEAGQSNDQPYDRLYERERHFIEDRRILPLVILPEYAGLGVNVRNWLPASWGEWRLADVWLEPNEKVSTLQDGDAAKNPAKLPAAGVRP